MSPQTTAFRDLCGVVGEDLEGTLRVSLTMLTGRCGIRAMPQSRWRDEYKEEAAKTMGQMKLGAKQAE